MVATSTRSGRNFILTLNEATLEYYQDVYAYLRGLRGCNYILVTEHIGEPVMNKHYHIYVQYENSKRLSIARLRGAHVEVSYGSAQKNIDYLWARDDKHTELGVTAVLVDEDGEPRLKGDYSVKTLMDIKEKENLPDYRMYNTWKKIRNEESNRLSIGTWRKNVKVYYIQGPSAAGKSERAEEIVKIFTMIKGLKIPMKCFLMKLNSIKMGFIVVLMLIVLLMLPFLMTLELGL